MPLFCEIDEGHRTAGWCVYIICVGPVHFSIFTANACGKGAVTELHLSIPSSNYSLYSNRGLYGVVIWLEFRINSANRFVDIFKHDPGARVFHHVIHDEENFLPSAYVSMGLLIRDRFEIVELITEKHKQVTVDLKTAALSLQA
jgi:hypothetical protein